jgi:sugar phosphate isomerase/epimerase
MTPDKIAFNGANLVGRCTGYRFELKNWHQQDLKTVAITDEKEWRDICQEIKKAGFKAIEVWQSHASPQTLDAKKAERWKAIMDEAGLKPIGYAGHINAKGAQVCKWLGITQISGGLWPPHSPTDPKELTSICEESGVLYNYENHPEKSAEEMLSKIGGGNRWLALCVDTGWFGTQGIDAAKFIRGAGSRVRHVHLKDVKASGGHETCILGTGVVDLKGCLKALKEIGYQGWLSWEDEPEDRNPFDSAVRNREWIEQQLAAI